MGDAKFLKPALLGKIRAGVGGEHSSALYDITVAEAKEKSWLNGSALQRAVVAGQEVPCGPEG